MLRFRVLILLLIIVGISRVTLVAAQASTPQADLSQLSPYLDDSLRLAEANDLTGAATALTAFRAGWPAIEDGIRARSRSTYRDIENLMGDARYAFEHADQSGGIAALRQLIAVTTAFVTGTQTPDASVPTTTTSLPAFQQHLDVVQAAITRQDASAALTALAAVQTLWPDVEGPVKVRSATVYARIEGLLPQAAAQLRQGDLAGAATSIATMTAELQPFMAASSYGAFDAASILLREGLEALLVIAALLAFLKRSGNGDKQRWIWLGGLAGVLASIATAFIINLAFAGIAMGSNRELLEGVTGLVAAVMLFSVSYWLHSKAQLGAWQQYIQTKTTAALATGSLTSLALLTFLSIYREGAETTLFYIGIAPSIATRDLLIGVSLATTILMLCGVAVLWLGVRIPLRPFFHVTSGLIFYLGFKFIGTGLHGLQIAQFVPATPASILPTSSFFGLFPTWETTLPQVLLLMAAGGVFWLTRRRTQPAQTTVAHS